MGKLSKSSLCICFFWNSPYFWSICLKGCEFQSCSYNCAFTSPYPCLEEISVSGGFQNLQSREQREMGWTSVWGVPGFPSTPLSLFNVAFLLPNISLDPFPNTCLTTLITRDLQSMPLFRTLSSYTHRPTGLG